MAHDESNSGVRHGFDMALYAVRDVDRQIEYPDERGKEDYIKYNAQKDLLYKIYEAIKKEQEIEVHENDY
jgi:hypothetical protein